MLKIIQTSDPIKYAPIMKISSAINEFYCQLHGFEYNKFIGLKKGCASVHAAYNRAYLLKQLVDGGYRGWVLYLDADAYIHDLTFNATNYLIDKNSYSFIAAEASSSIQEKWAINNGIFFPNLGIPEGQFIANMLHQQVEKMVPESYWNDSNAGWAPPEYDDQNLLYGILGTFPEILKTVYKAPSEELNYNSNSFRQVLRTFGSLEDRAQSLRECSHASLQYFISRQMPKFLHAYTVLSDR
jgi:hypothetical protein